MTMNLMAHSVSDAGGFQGVSGPTPEYIFKNGVVSQMFSLETIVAYFGPPAL